jgi:hypothetical protein
MSWRFLEIPGDVGLIGHQDKVRTTSRSIGDADILRKLVFQWIQLETLMIIICPSEMALLNWSAPNKKCTNHN